MVIINVVNIIVIVIINIITIAKKLGILLKKG